MDQMLTEDTASHLLRSEYNLEEANEKIIYLRKEVDSKDCELAKVSDSLQYHMDQLEDATEKVKALSTENKELKEVKEETKNSIARYRQEATTFRIKNGDLTDEMEGLRASHKQLEKDKQQY